MADILFDLKNLSKKHTRGGEELVIFSGLNMHIYKGDFIAIMGPSGSGKTTLLNLLGGIDQPSSGEVLFANKRIDNIGENALAEWRGQHVGFIFQFYNLMPMLTAARNVELPLLLTNMSKTERQERIDSALKLVQLDNRTGHYPREMSGGQQQRVAIARAIVSNPELLLCDEPTGDLDRKTANDVLEMLRMLNDELGKTIIMVTHDPEAARYAKRVLHLDKGQFIEQEIAA